MRMTKMLMKVNRKGRVDTSSRARNLINTMNSKNSVLRRHKDDQHQHLRHFLRHYVYQLHQSHEL